MKAFTLVVPNEEGGSLPEVPSPQRTRNWCLSLPLSNERQEGVTSCAGVQVCSYPANAETRELSNTIFFCKRKKTPKRSHTCCACREIAATIRTQNILYSTKPTSEYLRTHFPLEYAPPDETAQMCEARHVITRHIRTRSPPLSPFVPSPRYLIHHSTPSKVTSILPSQTRCYPHPRPCPSQTLDHGFRSHSPRQCQIPRLLYQPNRPHPRQSSVIARRHSYHRREREHKCALEQGKLSQRARSDEVGRLGKSRPTWEMGK